MINLECWERKKGENYYSCNSIWNNLKQNTNEYTFWFQTREGVEYLLLTPDRCLIFPSVDYVRNLVTKHSIKQAIPVVIDCSHIYGADFTAAKVQYIISVY